MPWDEGLVNSLVYDAPDPAEGRVVSYVKAINEALDASRSRTIRRVFVLGQGVDDPSAMFGTTRGPAGTVRRGSRVRHAAVRRRHDGRLAPARP